MQYTKEKYNVYRVLIKDLIKNKIFDNYLIKVPESELFFIEKSIHNNHPNNTLEITFTLKN